jgi:hypothetical protein
MGFTGRSSRGGTLADLARWTARTGARDTCASQSESMSAMNKRQLIEGIRELNQTAQPEFLAQFDEDALRQYLQHLNTAQEKRLKVAGWVKSIPKPKFRLVS